MTTKTRFLRHLVGNVETSRETELENQCLSATNWTTAKLESELHSVQDKFSGLLTREGALEVLCRNNNVPVPKRERSYSFLTLTEAAALPEGASASFVARVKHVYAPKSFVTKSEKGERRGRVCNIAVSDGHADGVLVLWNKDVDLVQYGGLERNDLVKVANAQVKHPGEYSSGMTTRITVIDAGGEGDDGSMPKSPEKRVALSQAKPGDEGIDFHCRVLSVNNIREFTRNRNGKEEAGQVCDALVSDGAASGRLVGWDENARVVSSLKVGEAVKVEGASCRTGNRGDLELHASWNGRIVRNATGHGLPEREEIWRQMYEEKSLGEAPLDKQCIVTARLAELTECRMIEKPTADGKTRIIILLKTVLEDGSGRTPCVFFDNQALEVLGVTELTVDAQAALDIKRPYLIGSEVTAVVTAKDSFNRRELTASHVISVAGKKPAD